MAFRVLMPISLACALAGCIPAQSLSQGERDRALSELHATRKEFLDIVTKVSDAQWAFKPSPQAWSLAEIAEHITLSETELPAMVAKAMAEPANPLKLSEAKGKDAMILEKVPMRDQKAQAPPILQPRGKWPTRAALVAAFQAARDRNLAYLRETNDPLRAHELDHPAMGPLDCYQWYLLIGAHTERHIDQMREVMTNPAFPKK
jgi:hypothetical protein